MEERPGQSSRNGRNPEARDVLRSWATRARISECNSCRILEVMQRNMCFILKAEGALERSKHPMNLVPGRKTLTAVFKCTGRDKVEQRRAGDNSHPG